MPSGNETVQVIRRPKVDKLSTAAAAEPDTFDLEDCQVIPRQAIEEGRGWVTLDGWDVYCFTDPGREVLFTDRVKIRGVEHEILGKPARFDKRGQFKAMKISATRVGSA